MYVVIPANPIPMIDQEHCSAFSVYAPKRLIPNRLSKSRMYCWIWSPMVILPIKNKSPVKTLCKEAEKIELRCLNSSSMEMHTKKEMLTNVSLFKSVSVKGIPTCRCNSSLMLSKYYCGAAVVSEFACLRNDDFFYSVLQGIECIFEFWNHAALDNSLVFILFE